MFLDHHMHSEFYVVEEAEAKKVNDTKAAGGRVICVGTTSCRTVESASTEDGILQAKQAGPISSFTLDISLRSWMR